MAPRDGIEPPQDVVLETIALPLSYLDVACSTIAITGIMPNTNAMLTPTMNSTSWLRMLPRNCIQWLDDDAGCTYAIPSPTGGCLPDPVALPSATGLPVNCSRLARMPPFNQLALCL